MLRRPPRSTRTDTRFPYTTLFRSASAIYGADAVAGVVNILLKRDFEGVAAMARLGASTEGGNVQQPYGILGGKTWSSGNLLAAYDYSRSSAILAGDRSYAIANNPDTTRSVAHTAELQSLMRISYPVFLF